MADQFPRISRNELEIWLNLSTTKVYLTCLKDSIADIGDVISSGSYVDHANNDLTCNNLSSLTGGRKALERPCDPEALLNAFEMLEVEDDNG